MAKSQLNVWLIQPLRYVGDLFCLQITDLKPQCTIDVLSQQPHSLGVHVRCSPKKTFYTFVWHMQGLAWMARTGTHEQN